MNILIRSCKKITSLMEKQLVVGRLSWAERVQLTMHTSMCSACKSYQKQSKTMDKVFSQHMKSKSNSALTLPIVAKKRIIKALEKK